MKFDKLIKTTTQNTNDSSDRGTNFEEVKRRMNGICKSLNWPSDQYQPLKTIESLKKYILKFDRILYSEISGYYFSLSEEGRGNFVSNVEKLLIKCFSDNEVPKNIKDYVIKIYDHVHLALHQAEKLQSSREEDELKHIFATKLEPVKDKLENQIEEKVRETQKEIYAQLISLVGIFTAMAFLIFGSISAFWEFCKHSFT